MTINLGMDPAMLLSIINTKLRNSGDPLRVLAENEGIDETALKEKLEKEGYTYDPQTNQFK